PRAWLWSISIKTERDEAVPIVWNNIDADEREELLHLAAEGPPAELFRANLPPSELPDVKDRLTWELLSELKKIGGRLSRAATTRLTGLNATHREWNEEGGAETLGIDAALDAG